MEILSVVCSCWSFRQKIQKSSRTTWNFFTQTLESSLWKKGAFRAAERVWLSSHLCVCIVCGCVCVCLRCPFRMPNKTKNGFHVCVSLLLGLLIIIITSVSLSFTRFSWTFFGGNWQHEPVTPEHKSTNWNGGSISIVWRAVRPLRKLSRVQAEFSFFSHKKSDFNINLRFLKRGTKYLKSCS